MQWTIGVGRRELVGPSSTAGPDAGVGDAPPPGRRVIVNADDFGRSAGVNDGVVQAYDEGIVTSASLMVRWPESEAAAACARSRPGLGLGLHFDLGEWMPTGDGWEAVYEVVRTDDADAVATELANQLGRFHKLMDRSPTHIDSHQHVHLVEPASSVVADFARRLGIPVRLVSRGIDHCGGFYGQGADGSPYPEGITVDRLLSLLGGAGGAPTELSCHPGSAEPLASAYAAERQVELAVLCDPRVWEYVQTAEIALISYAHLQRVGPDEFAAADAWLDIGA